MVGLWGRTMRESAAVEGQGEFRGRVGTNLGIRSSKSALHGLVHWLASTYAKSGITVNGVAPALIQETTMLPGKNEELAQSKSMHFSPSHGTYSQSALLSNYHSD
jgi:3-oxoacyl-[acyl-carrier protein] reductase